MDTARQAEAAKQAASSPAGRPYGYVYLTTNKVSGKMYVGKKNGMFKPSYLGSGKILRLAVEKNGINSFSVKPIMWARSCSELNDFEVSAIAEYRGLHGREMLYNIANGGEGAEGNTHTPEARAKISAWRKLNPFTQKDKDRISRALKGKIVSMETRKRLSEAGMGHSVSEEARRKMSEAKKGCVAGMFGKAHSQAAKTRMRCSNALYWSERRCMEIILGREKLARATIHYGEVPPTWHKK